MASLIWVFYYLFHLFKTVNVSSGVLWHRVLIVLLLEKVAVIKGANGGAGTEGTVSLLCIKLMMASLLCENDLTKQ